MGYTVLGNAIGHDDYDLTTSFDIPDNDMNIVFVAPKSGIVEIELQVLHDGGSGGSGDVTIGLATDTSETTLGTTYEKGVLGSPRFDHMNINHKWIIQGLTAGTTYQYWFMVKTSNTTGTPTLLWGGTSSGRYPDFIMKATALPSNAAIET